MKNTIKAAVIASIYAMLLSFLQGGQSSTQDYIEACKNRHKGDVPLPLKVVSPEPTPIVGEEATVELTFIVDAEGKPTNIKVAEATEPYAGDAAMNAVKQWRFEPVYVSGAPVAKKVSLRVRFKAD